VGKGRRVDDYLEVRKRRGIYFLNETSDCAMNLNKNLLSANQFFSLIDMKRKFINSDNHKFHQYQ
jgi:hypothetical protein